MKLSSIFSFDRTTSIFLILVILIPMFQSCQKGSELIGGVEHPLEYSPSTVINNTVYNNGDTYNINGDATIYQGNYVFTSTTNNNSYVWSPVTNNFVTTNVVNNFNNVNVNNTTNYYNSTTNNLYQYTFTVNNQMVFNTTNVVNNVTTNNVWNTTNNTWNTVTIQNWMYLCNSCGCDTTLVPYVDTVFIHQTDTIVDLDTVIQFVPHGVKMLAFGKNEWSWKAKMMCESALEHFDGGADSIRTLFQMGPKSNTYATIRRTSGLQSGFYSYEMPSTQSGQTLYCNVAAQSPGGWSLTDPLSTCQGINSMPGAVQGKSFAITPLGNLPGTYDWPHTTSIQFENGGNSQQNPTIELSVITADLAAYNAAMGGFPIKVETWYPVFEKINNGTSTIDAVYRDYGNGPGSSNEWRDVAGYVYYHQ